MKKCITILFTKLNLLSSSLCFPGHDTVRGEHTIRSSLRRAGPDAVPAVSHGHLQRNDPQLWLLVLAHAACHSPKCCHHGDHCFLPEGQTAAETGAEKANGICSKRRNFILNSALCCFVVTFLSSVVCQPPSSYWLASLDSRHGWGQPWLTVTLW